MRTTDIPQIEAFPEGSKVIGLVETEPGVQRLRLGPVSAGPAGSAIKKYSATVYQTGTSNPTAVEIENTLGGSVVWTREDMGAYLATLAGAFPEGKVFSPQMNVFTWISTPEADNTTMIVVPQPSGDCFKLTTQMGSEAVDDMLNGVLVQVFVLPA